MTGFMTVQVQGVDGVQRLLKNLENLPGALHNKAAQEYGANLVTDLHESLHEANVDEFTGTLYDGGIHWEMLPNQQSVLLIRTYGVMLDSMPSHFVPFQDRAQLLAWAEQARSQHIRLRAARFRADGDPRLGVYVRRHPFIINGLARANSKRHLIFLRQVQDFVRQAAT